MATFGQGKPLFNSQPDFPKWHPDTTKRRRREPRRKDRQRNEPIKPEDVTDSSIILREVRETLEKKEY